MLIPLVKNITPIVWTTDSSRRVVSYDFDAHGEHLMLLDDTGKLYILDTEQNYKQTAVLDIFPNGLAEDGVPEFIVNPNTEVVYMIDSSNKQIIEIDPDDGEI